MKETILFMGMQWGDEGKGKIIHAFTKRLGCDLLVRFNGGANAGHTVESDEGIRKAFNQLPSGSGIRGVRSVIANGAVIDPIKLAKEARAMDKSQFIISDAAHIVTQKHLTADATQEQQRWTKIGTTKSGNGPAYSDKMARFGIRVGDLMQRKELLGHGQLEHLRKALAFANAQVMNTQVYLRSVQKSEEGVMILEGAHGWELDIDHGDYPFVTSSSCGIGGAAIGTGLDPRTITKVIGVVKSYSTRVGAGSFPNYMTEVERTELNDHHAEVGTVTGRQRRVDWIDVGRIRAACQANGVDEVALTHFDVLQGFHAVKIVDEDHVVTMEGWTGKPASKCKNFEELPLRARFFVREVERRIKVPVRLLSVGPKESQLIWVNKA